MPQKIRLRDLDPELRNMIAGSEVSSGELNTILSYYRKKTDIIPEQDIDVQYRNRIYDSINEVKTKLDEHLKKVLVVAKKDLAPELQQELDLIEQKINNLKGGEDYGSVIQELQFNFNNLKNVVNNLDLDKYDSQSKDILKKVGSIQDKIDEIKTFDEAIDAELNGLRDELKNKRDKANQITKTDLSDDVVNDIKKAVEALEEVNKLAILVNSKRDNTVKIEKDDLSSEVINEIANGISASNRLTELSNYLDSKRDKADLIGEKDLSADLITNIQKGISALERTNNILNSLNAKRDKDVLINKSDLSDDIVAELEKNEEILNQITDIRNAIETKRSKDVLINESDLENNIVSTLQKVEPLKEKVDNILSEIDGRFNEKMDKGVPISEESLDNDVQDKLNKGNNAYDLANDINGRINIFPDVDAGDFLSVLTPLGNVGGKSILSFMTTVENEADVSAYKNDKDVTGVLALDSGEYYSWKEVGSTPDSNTGTSGATAKDKEFTKIENHLKEHTPLWNTFIVDEKSLQIVAFVKKGGTLIRLINKRSVLLNAGQSKSFSRLQSMNISVKVFGKDSKGNYIPADAYVTVSYSQNAYTVTNESDENLDLIIVER